MTRTRIVLVLVLAALLAALAVAVVAPDRVLRAEFARQRWLAGAEVHSVRAGGHRWAYLEAGRGPLVVLVHGFTGSKENWLPLMRRLDRDYRVVAPDLPGWGESERKPDADYGPEAQADRLAEFLERLKERPVLLVGHSMGGQIAGLMLARHPGTAARLLLMSSAGVRFDANRFSREVLAGRNPFEVTDVAQLHRYLGIVFTDPPWVPWPVDRALVRRRRADAAFEQRVLDEVGRGPQAALLQARLPELRLPVLLLWCRDDKVIDVSAARVFGAGLPDSRTVLLDGCGHMPMMARPDDVAAAIVRFTAPR